MSNELPRFNPLSLSVEELARMLSNAGEKRITVEEIKADIKAGAPVERNGRMNLVYYMAWLMREMQSK